MIIVPKALTSRELQVVTLIAEGKQDKDVAQLLSIALNTAKVHRMHIYHKLGFHAVADLIHWALAKGLVKNKYADTNDQVDQADRLDARE